jgi:hypothetical protein
MLNEEQLEEAQRVLHTREAERHRQYEAECARRYREEEKRFWERMTAKYPHLDQDTMYDIYSEMREFFE